MHVPCAGLSLAADFGSRLVCFRLSPFAIGASDAPSDAVVAAAAAAAALPDLASLDLTSLTSAIDEDAGTCESPSPPDRRFFFCADIFPTRQHTPPPPHNT